MKDTRITVRFRADQIEKIKKMEEEMKMTPSEIIRRALDEFQSNNEQTEQLEQLIGTIAEYLAKFDEKLTKISEWAEIQVAKQDAWERSHSRYP